MQLFVFIMNTEDSSNDGGSNGGVLSQLPDSNNRTVPPNAEIENDEVQEMKGNTMDKEEEQKLKQMMIKMGFIPVPSCSQRQSGNPVVVIEDYVAADDGQLTVCNGEIVALILDISETPTGLIKIQKENGEEGYIPTSCTTVLETAVQELQRENEDLKAKMEVMQCTMDEQKDQILSIKKYILAASTADASD